jgi:hypothetical protein
VFHDPTIGTVRHANVPYVHSVAQQPVNQSASQPIATNVMALYQQPPTLSCLLLGTRRKLLPLLVLLGRPLLLLLLWMLISGTSIAAR